MLIVSLSLSLSLAYLVETRINYHPKIYEKPLQVLSLELQSNSMVLGKPSVMTCMLSSFLGTLVVVICAEPSKMSPKDTLQARRQENNNLYIFELLSYL